MPRTPRRLRPVALIVAVFALFALGTSTALGLRRTEPAKPRAGERPARSGPPAVPPAAPRRSPAAEVPSSFPHAGPGTWWYAESTGPVFGSAGPVRRYRVAVESNIPFGVTDWSKT